MLWKTYDSKNKRFTVEIETKKLNVAKTLLIKLVKRQYFNEEIKCLINKKYVVNEVS